MKKSKFKEFLKRKDIVISGKRYGIDALAAMAQGLFASLLIGTIIGTAGELLMRVDIAGLNAPGEFFVQIASFAKAVAGPAMAIAIGYALKAPPLVLFSLVAVGWSANSLGGAGGPLAVFFIAVIATEFGKVVSKETVVDIIVTPLVTIFVGCSLSVVFASYIGIAASSIGQAIMWATTQNPFLMGIIVSVLVGVALTLPISSAAICAALGLTGLAGGAALAGCCANMVGFAVMSFRENRWGGFFAQGLGTSMLQMGNIVRNPRIWIPPIISSAIIGPIATTIFKLEMNGPPISSGMGTCGLVGPIGVVSGWLTPFVNEAGNAVAEVTPLTAFNWLGLILVAFILPALLTWLISLFFRKINWIRENDLKLDL